MSTKKTDTALNVDATPDTEEALKAQVAAARSSGAPVVTTLRTDARVFARITDGIYREPASALRELIANSYDADATEVRVETDAPRFSKIVVRDNGRGLSEEALVHVMCHIGGSLKRTEEGIDFGLVSSDDPTVSKGGRKLIGKLGIGLFSVSQLTHHLIIVTKIRGENYRRVCDILLRPQRDEDKPDATDEKGFVTGEAQISTVFAEDTDTQGTEITLLEIRPFVRESLQSTARWDAIAQELKLAAAISDPDSTTNDDELEEDEDVDEEFRLRPKMPIFHIGEVSRQDDEVLLKDAKLPWNSTDKASDKFGKLVRSIHDLSNPSTGSEKTKLTDVVDSYLRMLWTLSLSIPVPYVGKHPFDLDSTDGMGFYALSNKSSGKAEPIQLAQGQTIRTKLNLTSGVNTGALPFSVVVDDVELFRPLVYTHSELGSDDSNKPLLFFGKLKTDLSALAEEYRGGSLEFEAYLSWKPKIVPAEHNGVMIRINGASGILFDNKFLEYQISELTRLKQVTAEIFIKKGLDAALNIDRESFNIAHPHYQYISKWLHHALKQLMSRHKALQQGKSFSHLENKKAEAIVQLKEIVQSDPHKSPPSTERQIIFSGTEKSGQLEIPSDSSIVFEKKALFASRTARPVTRNDRLRESLFEEKIKAVAILLDRYGLLEKLEQEEQATLLKSIVDIFSVELKK